jgi:hypothetical protein
MTVKPQKRVLPGEKPEGGDGILKGSPSPCR